jgi:hypothetical protein
MGRRGASPAHYEFPDVDPAREGAELGHELQIVASSATYGIQHADWVLRLTRPQPPSARRLNEVDVRLAEEALLEQLQSRELHPALVAEPQ